MKINLITVGHKMPVWITSGYHEYSKRLPREWQLQLIEVAPCKQKNSLTIDQVKLEEYKRIKAKIPKHSKVIALDEKGKQFNSKKLASKLETIMSNGVDLSLLIGGADGLPAECRKEVDEIWSISDFTLPHHLVRVVIVEQLYRAWSIINNHPYHRE